MPSLITQKQLLVRFPFSEFYRFISEFCTLIFWLLLKSGFCRTLCLKISYCPFPDRCSSQGKVKFYNQCLLERALINLLWTAKKCWQNALPYCLTCMWLPAFSHSWEAIPAACPEVGGGTDTPQLLGWVQKVLRVRLTGTLRNLQLVQASIQIQLVFWALNFPQSSSSVSFIFSPWLLNKICKRLCQIPYLQRSV